ncbi:hypothetical protein D3C79_778070 [compost metagenome]
MRDGFLTPFKRVAGVMAQPLITWCELRAEITQKGVHGDTVGQRDAELVWIFVQPGLQCCALAVGQYRAYLLMRLKPFMRLGTYRRQVELMRQIVIAGADQVGELVFQRADDRLLHAFGETAAGAEIHQFEARDIHVGADGFKLRQFAAQMGYRHVRCHLRRTVTVHHFADHCQQGDLPQNHFAPRAGNADMQSAVTIVDLNLLRVIAEITQPAQVVLTEERQP